VSALDKSDEKGCKSVLQQIQSISKQYKGGAIPQWLTQIAQLYIVNGFFVSSSVDKKKAKVCLVCLSVTNSHKKLIPNLIEYLSTTPVPSSVQNLCVQNLLDLVAKVVDSLRRTRGNLAVECSNAYRYYCS
jgi:hypothetical protein